MPEGETYEGTVKAVQEAVDPGALGVDVKRIVRTLDGHLLVEMVGGPKAADGEATLSRAVRDKAGDLAGWVVQLGTSLEVEIVDLDPGAEREDVLAALETAMDSLGDESPESLKAQITITGLWRVKSSTKIATAKIPRAAAKLSSLKFGWTVTKVRPRRPEPLRCFRCHGFGHPSSKCEGPDLTGRCRKCGGAGHHEKDCAEDEKCIACDRFGKKYLPHKTGSGGCLARRCSGAGGVRGPIAAP